MTTKESILRTIKSNLREIYRYGIKDIGLFGSYVREEQSAESEIDILDRTRWHPSSDPLAFDKLVQSERVGCVGGFVNSC